MKIRLGIFIGQLARSFILEIVIPFRMPSDDLDLIAVNLIDYRKDLQTLQPSRILALVVL
jgi:hypothetical protein